MSKRPEGASPEAREIQIINLERARRTAAIEEATAPIDETISPKRRRARLRKLAGIIFKANLITSNRKQ
jgi:hypothetical protein